MSVFHENMLLGSSGQGGAAAGYQIERSLRFNSADSAYLSRTPASAGNRKTWTWSGWLKRSSITLATGLFAAGSGTTNLSAIYVGTDGKLWYYDYLSGVFATQVITQAVYRDFSAWYHIVVAVDTTQATAANRVKIYVNGSQVTAFSTATYPTQNLDTQINTATTHTINKESNFYNNYGDHYLADIHFIEGQALTPSGFGETDTNGIWQPKEYTGTYGTRGFQLKFADNSAATATTLGKDTSGNGNNWTPNNLSVTAGAGNDSLVDSPTNYGTDTGAGGEVRGNYCTLNPLDNSATLTDGNLQLSHATTGQYRAARSTIQPGSSGLFYAECTVVNATGATVGAAFGLTTSSTSRTAALVNQTGAWVFYADSSRYIGRNGTAGSFAGTFTANTILRIAIDLANNRAWIGDATNWYDGSNGTTGNPATGANPTFTSLPSSGLFLVCEAAGVQTLVLNCGQRPFAYTAPSGFKALCTQNLPTPTITKPSTVMDVALWTGNGSARSITGLGFNPDLVWIKGRSGATDHALYDSVRGVEKRLESNNTDAEVTSDGGVTAFNSDGFSLGTLAQVNTNTATYAGWTWDAGSSTVTNTSGTISSQVRANASAGISIVTYTGNGTAGATIGHGLGIAPSFIVCKPRSNSGAWLVYHISTGNTAYLLLNATDTAFSPSVEAWNYTTPNSTVFTAGTGASVNGNGSSHVAYCFAPVAGYSAFGSYIGNGNADGPMVFTNMRPRWIMIKNTSYAGQSWWILDTARDDYNATDNYLQANNANAEGTFAVGDILSNGFKIRTTDFALNRSGDSFIYAAFAEAPLALARAR